MEVIYIVKTDDLFLYEAKFVPELLQDKKPGGNLDVSLIHTYRYIDDALSNNNDNFHNHAHLMNTK
jgi:hypothetical protein